MKARVCLIYFVRDCSLIIEMMIQKNLKGLEKMEVLSRSQVFLGNKYNSYVHTARNAKATS